MSVTDKIVSDCYFDRITTVMYGTNTHLIKLLLWGLSNLTGIQKYAHAFIHNEKCVNRCLFLLSNQNVVLASEAGFVVSQALITISEQVLHRVWA